MNVFNLWSLLTQNPFGTLISSVICIFITWYGNYHWQRRKLYQSAAQVKGPITLPFIGNALYFGGSTTDIFNNFLHLSTEFESPARIWLGQRLMFVIWKANDSETILNSPHGLHKDELLKFVEVLVGTGLFTASVPVWKRHRKIIMPTFNQKILDGFVDVFSEQSKILVEQLKIEAGKGPFDIFDYVSRCSLDIICETAMGITVNAQTTESNYMKWINKALNVIFTRMFSVVYHNDFIFNLTSMAKEQNDAIKKINEFAGTVIKNKRTAYQKKLKESRERPEALIEEELCKRKPFLQQLIELSEEGANLTDQELLDEVNTFMLAGSETTASTDCFVFVVLGMFPEIQRKVYEEVVDVLGPDRSVEVADLGKLQYLERILKETMRIFPAAAVVIRAIREDIKLESFTLPAGSSALVLPIGLHRDPNAWPNPLKFDPDRFLPEEVAKRHPYSWLPFAGGPRNCIGARYAMMVMKVLIAMVVRKYRFFADYESLEAIKLKAELIVRPANGFRVSMELRG